MSDEFKAGMTAGILEKTARLSNYSRSQVFNILKEIRKNLKK